MNSVFPSPPARLLLHYGSFAVLCQSALLLLWIRSTDPSVTAEVLRHRFLPLLEYPLMSIALLLGGALLIDWVLWKETR